MRATAAIFFLALAAAPTLAQSAAQTPAQAVVEQHGTTVMPFDQSRTMHMFHSMPNGGMMMVMSTDGDPAQIALIRSHLSAEATAFAAGNYTDAAAIHGKDMPGIAVLTMKAAAVHITYQEAPMGAGILFATSDPDALAAIHDWFAAQVKDHGAHAMMMQ